MLACPGFYDILPCKKMSFKNKSLPEILRQSAGRFADHKAVSFAGRVTDFAGLDRITDSVAGGLAALGIGKGNRVGLYCPNSDAFVFAYFGILKAGAVVVPVNLLLNHKEIAYILNDSGARALVFHQAFVENVRALDDLLANPLPRIVMGSERAGESDTLWQDILAAGAAPPSPDLDPAEDLAAILYTSGTTGFPKGAMLTHRNLASNVSSTSQALKLEAGREIFLVVLPMFHAFAATACMLTPLLNGCSIVPMPRFDPILAADMIENEKATVFMAVPSMFNLLMRLPPEYTAKFRSIRFCFSGGAAMPVQLMKQFEDRFDLLIYEGDGPTECSPVTCVNPIGGKRTPGSVGLPLPDVEMKILDDAGAELAVGQVGEICVRGPNVMKGYWQRPDETRDSFFGEWFRTGDLGMKDDDGYFFIVDRKKDIIIVNGMNVYPRVIEEVLYKFAPVREAAVVGEPHELHGEVPVAYVSLKEGMTATTEDIRAFCHQNLGRHEVPRKVHFLPELPKNAAGKILKRALRKDGEIERGVRSPD